MRMWSAYHGFEFSARVGAIAEGLFVRAAAGAPRVSLALLDRDGDGAAFGAENLRSVLGVGGHRKEGADRQAWEGGKSG